MKHKISRNIYSWCPPEQIESQALVQLENTASLPCVYKHVAVMPDVHYGKGATVGSVIATKEAIIPAAIGVDIGCGMMAVKTNLNKDKVQENIGRLRSEIEKNVPVGFNRNQKVASNVANWSGWGAPTPSAFSSELKTKASLQVGTLGGGNHFIEICYDETDSIWLMLHSGSRGVGHALAMGHIEKANAEFLGCVENLPDPDLAYFVSAQPYFMDYIQDMLWAQSYAWINREEMMRKVMGSVDRVMNGVTRKLEVINCHHNFAQNETHYNEEVWVTRKGAIEAQKGKMGIIPGSMGASSYIVKGRGNPSSFNSCSHGAGRRMSRGQAKKTFTLDDFIEQTKGVECRKSKSLLDEIPQAYKNIEEVMSHQKDLVEVCAILKPLMSIKG